MWTDAAGSRRNWFRPLAFAAVVALALAANGRWTRSKQQNRAPLPVPDDVFPLSAAGFHMTALEPPEALGRQELWASYQAGSPALKAYVSLSYGVDSFHDWIGCFLIEGPQPLWSGSLTIPVQGGGAGFEATVLRQAGEVRAVAHSECWRGEWRGSELQNRWFALWRRPGHAVPLINAYVVGGDATAGPLRQQLNEFLSGLNWSGLNGVCRTDSSRR